MHTGTGHLIKEQGLWQHGDALAMAAGTETLTVTGRAQIAGRRGAHAVLTQKISVVHQVTLRGRHLCGQIHVAALTIAHAKLIFVGMTAKATGHGWAQHAAVVSDLGMAAHAVALYLGRVAGVREAQVLLCLDSAFDGERQAVATRALAGVVRLDVAAHAIGCARQVQGAVVPCPLDAAVTLHARDALQEVRPVREGLRSRSAKAEDVRACGQRQPATHQQEHSADHAPAAARGHASKQVLVPAHGAPQRLATRRSALTAEVLSGLARPSTAAAASHSLLACHCSATRPHGHTAPRPCE